MAVGLAVPKRYKGLTDFFFVDDIRIYSKFDATNCKYTKKVDVVTNLLDVVIKVICC